MVDNSGQTHSSRPSAGDIEGLMAQAREKGTGIYNWLELEKQFNLQVTYKGGDEGFHLQLNFLHGTLNRKLLDRVEKHSASALEAVKKAADLQIQAIMQNHRDSFSGISRVKPKAADLHSASRIFSQTFSDFPAFTPEDSLEKPQLYAGNLELVQISNLVQSILMDKLTGRLSIQRSNAWADIFFVNGEPCHAAGSRGMGEECFLQILCWQEGEFEFEPELRVPTRSIKDSLSSLLLRGARLLDDTNYLRNNGLRMSTVPHKTSSFLSEEQFEKALERKKGFNPKQLKQLYLSIDGNRTVEELVEDLELSRSDWITNLSCLMQCELVNLPTDPDQQQLLNVEPKKIENDLVKLRRLMVNPKTGLLQYEAFLYLIDYEISLARTPISMAVLSFDPVNSETQSKQIIRIIKTIPNFKGLVGHYGDHLAIAILGGKVSRATMIFRQIFRTLEKESTEQEFTLGVVVKLSCGIASLPNDVASLPSLLSACEMALDDARKGNKRFVIARDVIQPADG